MDSFQPLLPKRPSDPQHSPFTQTRNIASIPGRRNISRACDSCRERKIKCDGREPACTNCAGSNKRCLYENADRRSKEHWKCIIENLQQQNKWLEDTITSSRCNSFPQAVERLQQLRGLNASSLKGRELTLTGSSNPSTDDDSRSHSLHPTQSSGTPLSVAESMSPVGQPFNPQGDDHGAPSLDAGYNGLPLQLFARRSMSAYFACGSTLFYVMPRETCEGLMSSLYEHPADIKKSEACACCAVAAMGSQYSVEEIPDVAKETYFEYASSLLQDAAEEDALMGMRACIGLAVYLVLLKSSSARTMTATGLNITRWNMRRLRNANQESRLEWARVLRTLAFTECWLSSTLNYSFGLGLEEMSLLEELASSESSMNPFDSLNPSLIQSHLYKIAHTFARVQSQLQQSTCLSTHEVDRLSAMLDTWHKELPESLHLSALTAASSATSIHLKGPLLLMHMVHICSRIALYKTVILLTVGDRSSASDRSVAHKVLLLSEGLHSTYASFAQQLARVIGLLYKHQGVLSRCWLTIHPCFDASVILLLRTAQNLARGVRDSSISENLFYIHDCLLVLDCCSEQDIVAMKLNSIVIPFYQHLRRIAGNSMEVDRIDSTSPEIDSMSSEASDSDEMAIPAQLESIISQLVSAMDISFQDLWV